MATCAVAALLITVTNPALAARKSTRRVTKTQAAPAPAAPAQAAPTYTPGITIVPEVMTPQGQPRMYPVGGGQQSVWQPGMPVFIGDQIILRTFASTGDAVLKEVRVRLDNEPVTTITQAPWTVQLNTANWTPGYHFVEVFGQSTDAKAPVGSATVIFFAREPMPAPTAEAPQPQTITESSVTAETETTMEQPTTAVLGTRQTPEAAMQPPTHPGKEIPVNDQGIPEYTAGLDVTIHSRDEKAEEAIREQQAVQVNGPTLFSVQAGPDARVFMYALTRDGKEIFRSDALPISSLVRLQPKTDTQSVGLQPGEVMFWVWAGDGQNTFGAPDMVRVEIVPGQ